MPRFQGATGQPLASALKQLISQLSATLKQKVITINERGLTSTQWTVYNESSKRTTYSAVPTSAATAEAVVGDGFPISQKDNAGITTTAARHYSAEGISLTQTNGRGNATATETTAPRRTARKGATVNDTFAYNNRSELVNAVVSGTTHAYDYDNIGNRRIAIGGKEYSLYESNALNQYTAIQEGSSTTEPFAFTPAFDADGNQTRIKTATGIWTATYNALNRPVSYTRENEDGSRTVITADYDYMGRRVFKKVETVTTDSESGGETRTVLTNHRFLYRGYLQIAALDLTRATLNALWYIAWDPTEPVATRPLAIQKDGTWYTYGLDLPKNITEIYGTDGTIKTAYTYTPYGQVTASGSTAQPLQWSSEYADTDLALVYYNYRHYNPLDGRWCGRDIIRRLNMYVYAKMAFMVDLLGLKVFWASRDLENILGKLGLGNHHFIVMQFDSKSDAPKSPTKIS